MLEVKRYIVGFLSTNCYLIKNHDLGCAIIIDPGAMSGELEGDLSSCKKITHIFLTHGHFDHISAALKYKELTGAKLVIGEKEDKFTKNNELNLSCRFRRCMCESFQCDVLMNDNEKINFGDYQIRSILTPGHTEGSLCYVLDRIIFSGDTLMNGNIGRCDLPTGDEHKIKMSVNRLLGMDDDYVVYPGHGEPTTIKDEKARHLHGY